jgi:DNA-directed RNA polymerase subunit RPC12/RpoP
VHEKWRDYKCPHCSSLFAGKGDMVRHCRTVHERRRDHKCPHCSSRFGTASSMRRHCKTVYEEVRAHACPNCDGVAFGEMSHLNTHINTVYLKLREHACPYCESVAFGYKSSREGVCVDGRMEEAPGHRGRLALLLPFRQLRGGGLVDAIDKAVPHGTPHPRTAAKTTTEVQDFENVVP